MGTRPRFSLPSAYTVLMAIVVLAAAATWVLPAGRYDTLRYDDGRQLLVATRPAGEEPLPATQATLDRLGIGINVGQFLNGSIRKPVSIPRTYHAVAAHPQGPLAVFQAPILGIYDSIDVVLFVLIIGGFIGVFNRTGAFDAGIQVLVRRLRGREGWLVVIVTALIAVGGTTFGMAEETLAFYPILVPVFLAAGYDLLVPVAVIYVGSCMGTMASTSNPFATVIASDAAGVTWTAGLWGRLAMWGIGLAISIAYVLRYARRVKADPSRSLVKSRAAEPPPAVAVEHEGRTSAAPAFSGRVKLLLALFALTFVVMIYGVSRLDWWFPEMTTLFLTSAVLVALIQRTSERAFIHGFIEGAKDLLGVALIIGIARGVTIVLDHGLVSGSILYYAAGVVQHMSGVAFILGLLVLFFVLAFFIPSSSGLAVLTMPIVGALAVVAGVPREQVVNAYLYGQGIMGFLTPAGLVLPSLAMVNVRFDTWLRFILPLVAMLAVLSALFLSFGVAF